MSPDHVVQLGHHERGDDARTRMRREGLRESLVVILVGIERDDHPAAVEDQRQALGTVKLFLEPLTERRVLAAREKRNLRSGLLAILPAGQRS